MQRALRWSVASLLVLGVLLVPMFAVAQGSAERDLSDAREQLERIGEELETAEGDVEEAHDDLADAEDRLAEIEAIVNEVAAEVERQRFAVRDAERQLAEVEAQEAALLASFEDRVARLFKQGPDLTFETMMSAEGADELIARTELLSRVVDGDQVDLQRLEAVGIQVQAQRDVVREQQRQLEDQLAEQELVLEEAEELRASRALAAADAEARAEELAVERDELEDEEADLAALVERQQEQEAARQRGTQQQGSAPSGGGGGAPPAASGGLAWPMCAPATSEYGPRWGRMHRGIDLGAPTGAAIRAAQDGTVIFAGWQGGYGQLTLISHGGGLVTAYAHQSRMAVGQGARVSQGQVIGYVGTTGNVTGAHLHFETRAGGSAVNPRQYLTGSPC